MRPGPVETTVYLQFYLVRTPKALTAELEPSLEAERLIDVYFAGPGGFRIEGPDNLSDVTRVLWEAETLHTDPNM